MAGPFVRKARFAKSEGQAGFASTRFGKRDRALQPSSFRSLLQLFFGICIGKPEKESRLQGTTGMEEAWDLPGLGGAREMLRDDKHGLVTASSATRSTAS